jgi:hypothetical protein
VNQYLVQHGYTLWTSYQPGSRFWPFQWIESGWLLALSVLLIAATVWAGPPPRRLSHLTAAAQPASSHRPDDRGNQGHHADVSGAPPA